jgi:quercetin dioxygenase-like cupin family protein
MFGKHEESGYRIMVEGIEMKPLVWGDKNLMVEFRMKKGSALPAHSHPHEQTGYLISGQLRLNTEGESFDAGPGDSWSIKGDVEHSAEGLEDTVAIEIFYPVREEYLPKEDD